MIYKIVREQSLDGLELYVNSYIKNGWTPQGGVSVDDDGWYIQAIILKPQETYYGFYSPTMLREEPIVSKAPINITINQEK